MILAAVLLAAASPAESPALMQPTPAQAAQAAQVSSIPVKLDWNVGVPMRDGVRLSAKVYRPDLAGAPGPCVLEMTPYTADNYHERGMYFAAHGLTFAVIDVRGRGDSQGHFRPMIQEAQDGYDVVEWLAKQPYCNGKVGMWGGSYAGYDQWATAKSRPPHLSTIVPVAAAHPGVDFPYRTNISYTYILQWLLYTAGRTGQTNLFGDQDFWNGLWLDRATKGAAFATLPQAIGGGIDDARATLTEWTTHPEAGRYWDAYSPTEADYKALSLPILTITGGYDDDQPGALAYYSDFMRLATPEARARHFLVIGPWDHHGTRTPKIEVGGVRFGPASLLDVPKLHLDWYAWTMAGGPRPAFLQKPVAYYVADADVWRYADSLDAVTGRYARFSLSSIANADSVFGAGRIGEGDAPSGAPDHYIYDPRDLSLAELETKTDPASLVDQTLLLAHEGRELVYHSRPFEAATEVSGFFRLKAWIAIDQPDTDFKVSVYEIKASGESILLSTDQMRARYRLDVRHPAPITVSDPLLYDFDRFTFISRRVARGSRLRLVVAPIDSIASQKNYNAAKPVSDQTLADARPVTVRLFHDNLHPTTLYVPLAQP